jgi:hypothetical protein
MANQEISIRDQLMLLKAATIRTGAIHEAQVLQLKMWPLLIPNVIKAEVSIDAEKKLVFFKCESKGLRASKKMKLVCENIDAWVKQLLWPETTVTIKINDRQIYDSRTK